MNNLPFHVFGMIFFLACGDVADSGAATTPWSPVHVDAGSGGTVVPLAPACAPLNLTRSCSCGATLGVQTCTPMGFDGCHCRTSTGEVIVTEPSVDAGTPVTPLAQTPAGNLRNDITFDWERTEPSTGTCEAGNYAGQFTGVYLPQAAYAAPIPVFDLANGDRPGLAFTLEQSENGEELVIANGYVRGTADGLFPFDAKLTGTLDCKTATFTGELDGTYTIPIPFVEGPYSFKGPVSGRYDKNAHVFVMGKWDVGEYNPPPIAPIYGGTGDWNAKWLP